MKITIELTEAEVRGIKAYLKANDDAFDKEAIRGYVQGIVSGVINAPRESVSDYIIKAHLR